MQRLISDIICTVSENGLTSALNTCFIILSFVPVVIFGYQISLSNKISMIKIALFMLLTYVANFVLMLIMAWAESRFRNFGAQNGIRSFAFTPLLCGLFAKLFKITWRQGNAIWAVCLPFSHGIAHLGCVFLGCCFGYPCSWGIYNSYLEQYLFPVQILESAVAIAIGVFILRRVIRLNYNFDGREYPIMLILFGSTRFLCEFLRDNEKIMWGCSSLAFYALLMCVVGAVWILVINKKK